MIFKNANNQQQDKNDFLIVKGMREELRVSSIEFLTMMISIVLFCVDFTGTVLNERSSFTFHGWTCSLVKSKRRQIVYKNFILHFCKTVQENPFRGFLQTPLGFCLYFLIRNKDSLFKIPVTIGGCISIKNQLLLQPLCRNFLVEPRIIGHYPHNIVFF